MCVRHRANRHSSCMRRVCVPLYDVRRYVCSMTHACTYLSMTYACTSAHAHTRTLFARVCVYVCTCICTCMCICMYSDCALNTVALQSWSWGAQARSSTPRSHLHVYVHIYVYIVYTHIRSAMCGVCTHTYRSDLLCAQCAHIHVYQICYVRTYMCASVCAHVHMYRSVHMYM